MKIVKRIATFVPLQPIVKDVLMDGSGMLFPFEEQSNEGNVQSEIGQIINAIYSIRKRAVNYIKRVLMQASFSAKY